MDFNATSHIRAIVGGTQSHIPKTDLSSSELIAMALDKLRTPVNPHAAYDADKTYMFTIAPTDRNTVLAALYAVMGDNFTHAMVGGNFQVSPNKMGDALLKAAINGKQLPQAFARSETGVGAALPIEQVPELALAGQRSR